MRADVLKDLLERFWATVNGMDFHLGISPFAGENTKNQNKKIGICGWKVGERNLKAKGWEAFLNTEFKAKDFEAIRSKGKKKLELRVDRIREWEVGRVALAIWRQVGLKSEKFPY